MQSTDARSMKSVEVSWISACRSLQSAGRPATARSHATVKGVISRVSVGGAAAWDPESESVPFGTRRSRRTMLSGLAADPSRATVNRSSVGAARYGPAGPRSAAALSAASRSPSSSRSDALAQPSGSLDPMVFHCSATLTNETYTAGALAKVEKKHALNEDTLRDFLRDMLLIRRFEEKVEERFRAGELPGFLHVAIGQEAVAVGVCQAMEDGDIFASTHRAHGHTLARGTHPNAVMAELYGKVEGCSHGYGGSMHLYDIERGNYGANAVIGGGLPAVTGAGLAFKMRNEPRV